MRRWILIISLLRILDFASAQSTQVLQQFRFNVGPSTPGGYFELHYSNGQVMTKDMSASKSFSNTGLQYQPVMAIYRHTDAQPECSFTEYFYFSGEGCRYYSRTYRLACYDIDFTIEIEPMLSIVYPVEFCHDPTSDFPVVSVGQYNVGYSEYIWEYSANQVSWSSIAQSSESIELNPDEFEGISWNEVAYFRYTVSGCDFYALSSDITFNVQPPIVEAGVASPPRCQGELGAIEISTVSRSVGSGETFHYMLFQNLDTPSFVQNFGDNPSLDQLSESIGSISRTFGQSDPVIFDLPPSEIPYWVFIFPELTSGTSTISVGCGKPSIYKFYINDTNPISIETAQQYDPDCHDGNARVSLLVNNGIAPYSFQFNDVIFSDILDSESTFELPVNDFLSDFDVIVTDNNGCQDIVSLNGFSNPILPQLSVGIDEGNDINCFGGLASISATVDEPGNYTYNLMPDDVSIAGDEHGVSFAVGAGTYQIMAYTDLGCTTNTVEVTTSNPSTVELSLVSLKEPSCLEGSDGRVEVLASGGSETSYSYSINGVTFQVSGVFSDYSAGTYYLVAKDGNGCLSNTLEVEIVENTNPIAFTATPTGLTCFEANDGQIEVTNVQNFTGDLFYSLDDSFYQTSPLFTGLAAGVYTVYVQDGNCTVSESPINVSQPLELTSTIQSASPSCSGGSDGTLVVTPSGGTAPYSYLWTHDGGTTNTATAEAGDYEVTITDDNDCSIVMFGTILDPSDVFAEYSKSDISCNNVNDGSITIFNVSGGAGNYRFEWSDNALITTQNRTNLSGGLYTVTVYDENDCQYLIENIEIINPPLLTLNVSSFEDVDCKGTSTGSITLNGSGGTGNLEYRIASGSWQLTPAFTGLSSGDYTLEVRDENGCTATVSQTIAEPDEILSLNFAISNATCETDGKVVAIVSGGTSPYSYQWADFPSETSNTVSVPAGLYDLTVTDHNGCTISLAANVSSDNGAEVVELNKKQPDCSNTSNGEVTLQLTGIPPFIIDWDHDESSSETASNLSVGDNWVSIFDGNLCEVRHNVQFAGPQILQATKINETLPTCNGDTDGTITIEVSGGNGGYTINWANGQTEPTSTGLAAGTHNVTITDSKGCELITSFTLADKEALGLAVNTQSPSCAEETDGSITVTPQGGNGDYEYTWSHGPTTPTVNNLGAGAYTVTLTDMEGCSHEQDIILQDPEPTSLILNDITICSGQVYTVTSPTEALDYHWTGPSGFDFTTKSVSVSEAGSYNLMITDIKGCPVEASFEVVIDDELLNADFLVASEAFVGDTLVIIDISWPIPDAVEWALAEEARIISTNSEYTEVVFDEAGTYGLSMTCTLAGCNASFSQQVTIKNRGEETEESFVLAAPKEPMISKLSAYPNPTSGRFSLEVKLKEVGEATIRLIDASGNTVPYQQQLQGADNYTIEIDGSLLIAGMYFIQAQAGAEQKTFRMMIR